jgi:hypothetical protein
MALFKTHSAAIYRIDAHLIDVEVDMFASRNARDSVMVTNSFDYLTELQRYAQELTANLGAWMPWNYRGAIERAGV